MHADIHSFMNHPRVHPFVQRVLATDVEAIWLDTLHELSVVMYTIYRTCRNTLI